MERRAVVGGMVATSDFWDDKYEGGNRIWGDGPSELAKVAVECLRAGDRHSESLSVLDIGCGYGRDAAYLSRQLACCVMGVDISTEAIRMARQACAGMSNVEFRCWEFAQAQDRGYDVILVSNLYHLLQRDERRRLRATVARGLKPAGLLFLGALSTSDRQDFGKGAPVPSEPDSFVGKVYRHFCTRDELVEDFGFLSIRELYEHEYDEPHANGVAHHHVCWILVGEKRDVPRGCKR